MQNDVNLFQSKNINSRGLKNLTIFKLKIIKSFSQILLEFRDLLENIFKIKDRNN